MDSDIEEDDVVFGQRDDAKITKSGYIASFSSMSSPLSAKGRGTMKAAAGGAGAEPEVEKGSGAPIPIVAPELFRDETSFVENYVGDARKMFDYGYVTDDGEEMYTPFNFAPGTLPFILGQVFLREGRNKFSWLRTLFLRTLLPEDEYGFAQKQFQEGFEGFLAFFDGVVWQLVDDRYFSKNTAAARRQRDGHDRRGGPAPGQEIVIAATPSRDFKGLRARLAKHIEATAVSLSGGVSSSSPRSAACSFGLYPAVFLALFLADDVDTTHALVDIAARVSAEVAEVERRIFRFGYCSPAELKIAIAARSASGYEFDPEDQDQVQLRRLFFYYPEEYVVEKKVQQERGAANHQDQLLQNRQEAWHNSLAKWQSVEGAAQLLRVLFLATARTLAIREEDLGEKDMVDGHSFVGLVKALQQPRYHNPEGVPLPTLEECAAMTLIMAQNPRKLVPSRACENARIGMEKLFWRIAASNRARVPKGESREKYDELVKKNLEEARKILLSAKEGGQKEKQNHREAGAGFSCEKAAVGVKNNTTTAAVAEKKETAAAEEKSGGAGTTTTRERNKFPRKSAANSNGEAKDKEEDSYHLHEDVAKLGLEFDENQVANMMFKSLLSGSSDTGDLGEEFEDAEFDRRLLGLRSELGGEVFAALGLLSDSEAKDTVRQRWKHLRKTIAEEKRVQHQGPRRSTSTSSSTCAPDARVDEQRRAEKARLEELNRLGFDNSMSVHLARSMPALCAYHHEDDALPQAVMKTFLLLMFALLPPSLRLEAYDSTPEARPCPATRAPQPTRYARTSTADDRRHTLTREFFGHLATSFDFETAGGAGIRFREDPIRARRLRAAYEKCLGRKPKFDWVDAAARASTSVDPCAFLESLADHCFNMQAPPTSPCRLEVHLKMFRLLQAFFPHKLVRECREHEYGDVYAEHGPAEMLERKVFDYICLLQQHYEAAAQKEDEPGREAEGEEDAGADAAGGGGGGGRGLRNKHLVHDEARTAECRRLAARRIAESILAAFRLKKFFGNQAASCSETLLQLPHFALRREDWPRLRSAIFESGTAVGPSFLVGGDVFCQSGEGVSRDVQHDISHKAPAWCVEQWKQTMVRHGEQTGGIKTLPHAGEVLGRLCTTGVADCKYRSGADEDHHAALAPLASSGDHEDHIDFWMPYVVEDGRDASGAIHSTSDHAPEVEWIGRDAARPHGQEGEEEYAGEEKCAAAAPSVSSEDAGTTGISEGLSTDRHRMAFGDGAERIYDEQELDEAEHWKRFRTRNEQVLEEVAKLERDAITNRLRELRNDFQNRYRPEVLPVVAAKIFLADAPAYEVCCAPGLRFLPGFFQHAFKKLAVAHKIGLDWFPVAVYVSFSHEGGEDDDDESIFGRAYRRCGRRRQWLRLGAECFVLTVLLQEQDEPWLRQNIGGLHDEWKMKMARAEIIKDECNLSACDKELHSSSTLKEFCVRAAEIWVEQGVERLGKVHCESMREKIEEMKRAQRRAEKNTGAAGTATSSAVFLVPLVSFDRDHEDSNYCIQIHHFRSDIRDQQKEQTFGGAAPEKVP
eukprot:g7595.t1